MSLLVLAGLSALVMPVFLQSANALEAVLTIVSVVYLSWAFYSNIPYHKGWLKIAIWIILPIFCVSYFVIFFPNLQNEPLAKIFHRTTYGLLSLSYFFACFLIVGYNLRLVPPIYPANLENHIKNEGHLRSSYILKNTARNANADYIMLYIKKNNFEPKVKFCGWWRDTERRWEENQASEQDTFDSLIREVFANKEIKTEQNFMPVYTIHESGKKRFDFVQYAGIPVLHNDSAIGCMVLGWKHPRRPSMVEYLQVLCHILSPQIEYQREMWIIQEYDERLARVRQDVQKEIDKFSDNQTTEKIELHKNELEKAKKKVLQIAQDALGGKDSYLELDVRIPKQTIYLKEPAMEKKEPDESLSLSWNDLPVGSLHTFLAPDNVPHLWGKKGHAQIRSLIAEKLARALLDLEQMEAEIILSWFSASIKEASSENGWRCVVDRAALLIGAGTTAIQETEKISMEDNHSTTQNIFVDMKVLEIHLRLAPEYKSTLCLKTHGLAWTKKLENNRNPWYSLLVKMRNMSVQRLQEIKTVKSLRHNADIFQAAIALLMKKHRLQNSVSSLRFALSQYAASHPEDTKIRDMLREVEFMQSILKFMVEESLEGQERCTFLRAVLGAVSRFFDCKPVRIEYDAIPKDLELGISSNVLAEIFYELIYNALKHNPDDEKQIRRLEIKIWLNCQDRHYSSCTKTTCEVMVSDNGKGIPEQIRSQIFQMDKGEQKENGWGLPHIKQYLVNCGGNIELLDGIRGATFRLMVPKCEQKKGE